MSNSSNIISLNITKFPQNLLLPGEENDLTIQIINNSAKNENFTFVFDGENLETLFLSEDLKDQVEFASKETKNIGVRLNPTADGSGKLTINVKEKVPTSKFDKILGAYSFKNTETVDRLNRDDYFITMSLKELKKAEVEMEAMKKNYESTLSTSSPNKEAFTRITTEVIDKSIRNLAKGYLSNSNLQKAMELALQLSDGNEQTKLYINLLRAYAIDNLEEVLQIIKTLNDSNIQQNLYKSLVFDLLTINPIRAMDLSENIEDLNVRVKFLFTIIKELKEQSSTENEMANLLNRMINILFTLRELNAGNRKDQKLILESLKDAIHIMAEIKNPGLAHAIIERISIAEVKERIVKDLFDVIYVLVDEVQRKVESDLVYSQYFLLNTYVSNITNDVKKFSSIGGNVSTNILTGDFNFKLAFLSLSNFDFSIFPVMDRIYNDLKFNLKKEIGYYVFPSIQNFQNNDLTILKNTLSLFFKNFTNIAGNLLVLNLDFIPHLGKPTVILSSDSDLTLQSKIGKIGDSVNLIIDDSTFKGGKIYDNLKSIFPSTKCDVFNIILSYEFLNDYNAFLKLIQTLF
ncbi:MAG: hypothetical protein ACXAEX_08925 [Promethearchaeota archaeon]|jgi:hypothetical protein